MDWKEGLDEGTVKLLDRFCEDNDEGARDLNVGKLAQGYQELNKKFHQSPKIPTEDADESQWSEFYGKLGRPEKADEYKMDKSTLPEDFPWDEDFEKSMKQVAHEAGVSVKQFEKLAGKFLEYNGSSYLAAIEASKSAREKALTDLKAECEQKGTNYETFVNIAKHAVKEVDDKEGSLAKYLDSTGLGDDPVFIKLFNGIGYKILDDKLVQGIQTSKTNKPASKASQFEDAFNERYSDVNNS